MQTAPGGADVGLQFRLYRQTSGNRALLHRVELPQETLAKVGPSVDAIYSLGSGTAFLLHVCIMQSTMMSCNGVLCL